MGPDSRVLVRKSRKQAQQYYRLYKVQLYATVTKIVSLIAGSYDLGATATKWFTSYVEPFSCILEAGHQSNCRTVWILIFTILHVSTYFLFHVLFHTKITSLCLV